MQACWSTKFSFTCRRRGLSLVIRVTGLIQHPFAASASIAPAHEDRWRPQGRSRPLSIGVRGVCQARRSSTPTAFGSTAEGSRLVRRLHLKTKRPDVRNQRNFADNLHRARILHLHSSADLTTKPSLSLRPTRSTASDDPCLPPHCFSAHGSLLPAFHRARTSTARPALRESLSLRLHRLPSAY